MYVELFIVLDIFNTVDIFLYHNGLCNLIWIYGMWKQISNIKVIACEVWHYTITGPLKMADFRQQNMCISLSSSA
jgi:hypothetical protein